MDKETKRYKIESIVKCINDKKGDHIAVTVALDTDDPEICITRKDGGPVQLARHRVAELDQMFTTIDHNYMVVSEILNGMPCLCFSFSI